MHTRSNVARLCHPTKEGGKGLICIEKCTKKESKSLRGYLRETAEWMLQAALQEKVLDEKESIQNYQKRMREEKVKNWKEKALHGEFVRQTSDIAGENSWREYRKRNDKVALRVHWKMCSKYDIECTDKWFDHHPLAVAEYRDARITWDTTVYTDRKLQHNRPVTQESTLIDKAVPAGQDIIKAEDGKLTKYQSLAIKINRQHRALKVTVIPIVIGALGTISKNAKDLS
eukprot:gene7988-biopygen1696